MDVKIRPRENADVPQLAQVLVRVHAQDGYPVEGVAAPQEWLTPPRELAAWIALWDGQPIGHISLTRATDTDDAAILWRRTTGQDFSQLAIPVRLFVDPQHRHRGAGSLLMQAVFAFATGHQLALAFDVMLKDRDAIRLYERLGCQLLGTIVHEHSDGQAEPAAVYVAPSASVSA